VERGFLLQSFGRPGHLPGHSRLSVLPVVALVFWGLGLKRAFGRPPVYRGKILSSILSLLSLLLVGVAIFASFSARAISTSAVLRKNLRWTESARVSVQMRQLFVCQHQRGLSSDSVCAKLISHVGSERKTFWAVYITNWLEQRVA
jgi:hypothetical protein